MFGFGRQAKVDEVLEALEGYTRPLGKAAAKIFSRADVRHLLGVVDDVPTVVAMLTSGHSANFAREFAERADYRSIAKDLVDQARASGSDPQAVVEKEANEQYDTAKAFAEEFARMLDEREIVDTPEVRAFIAENAASQLASWAKYRLRLRTAYDETASG